MDGGREPAGRSHNPRRDDRTQRPALRHWRRNRARTDERGRRLQPHDEQMGPGAQPALQSQSVWPAATAPNGNIYAIAGINASYDLTSEVDAYNPASNSWSQVASLPSAREGLAATTGRDGTIYAIGGWVNNFSTLSAEVDAYNPATNTWAQVASLPAPCAGHSSQSPGPMGGSTPSVGVTRAGTSPKSTPTTRRRTSGRW